MTEALSLLLGCAGLWAAVSTFLAWRGRIRLREIEADDRRYSRAHAVEMAREDSQQIVTIEAMRALRDELRAKDSIIADLVAQVRRLRSERPPAPRDTDPEGKP